MSFERRLAFTIDTASEIQVSLEFDESRNTVTFRVISHQNGAEPEPNHGSVIALLINCLGVSVGRGILE
jgi:hypothetical protein